MIVKDLFVRLARFIPDNALKGIFQVPYGAAYKPLKEQVLKDPSRTPISFITDFIFGVNADSAQKRISQVTGVYVFVDYGNITTSIDEKVDVKTDSLHVAITVAAPLPTDQDQVAEVLIQDQCLEALSIIRAALRDDEDLPKGIRWMQHPSTIQPFTAKALANSLGWSMEFDVVGIDIV